MTFPLDSPTQTPAAAHGSPVPGGHDRQHGRRRNPAPTTPRSSLRTPTNQPRHSTQRVVEKVGRSITNSETPHYARARARGHNHRRALRTLGRSLSRIIWKCWQTHTPYDPKRHTALQRHITVTTPDPSGPRPDHAATQRMARTLTSPQIPTTA